MQPERRLQNYANEKLAAAVYVLATHPEEVCVRLRFAFEHLAAVPKSALPPAFRKRFEAIIHALTRLKPKPEFARTDERPYGLTDLSVTTRGIRKATGAAIAVRLTNLASEFDYHLRHSDEPE